MNKEDEIIKLAHHEQQEYCTTRARYRQGKKLTAVKVYTVAEESTHLLLTGVPSLKLHDELHKLCSRYGQVERLQLVSGYECESFTECFQVHYKKIQAARHAKRHLDTRGFFGGVLHVFYAPELETIHEVREKLNQRRREVTQRIAKNQGQNSETQSNHTATMESSKLKRLFTPSTSSSNYELNASNDGMIEQPEFKKVKRR